MKLFFFFLLFLIKTTSISAYINSFSLIPTLLLIKLNIAVIIMATVHITYILIKYVIN